MGLITLFTLFLSHLLQLASSRRRSSHRLDPGKVSHLQKNKCQLRPQHRFHRHEIRAFPVSIDSLDPAILRWACISRPGPNSYVLYRSVGVPCLPMISARWIRSGLSVRAVFAACVYRAFAGPARRIRGPAEAALRVRAIPVCKMIETCCSPSGETVDAIADIGHSPPGPRRTTASSRACWTCRPTATTP